MSILYAITDSHLMTGETLFTGVTAALEGGCRLVQYRDKSSETERRTAEASRLLKICRNYGATLLINDDVHLAKKIGAHGVHLGQTDGSPMAARALLGANAIIGVTCHASLALAQQAVSNGANYVAFGRFFPSHTKPDASPAPLSLLHDARLQLGDIPIVAIGGITLKNAQEVLTAGASMLAVSHSLFAAADVSQQARDFCRH
jgi:thiamine-phosphate pyrophosphorylase